MTAVVVAPDAGSGATGAGWVADPTSATGKSSFGFSLRFGPGVPNPSGAAVLVFPSVFQDVPVSVQIRTDGPVRVAFLGKSEMKLTAGATIKIIDPASGIIVPRPPAGSLARLTMIVAAVRPPAMGWKC